MEGLKQLLIDNADSFFWSLAVFALFVLILIKKGVKPVVAALDKRDETIKSQMDAAAEAQAKAEQIQKELAEQQAEADAKMAEMFKQAREEADRAKESIVAEGAREVDSMRSRALRDIQAAREQAVADMRTMMAEVATQVASKAITADLDASAHDRLIDEAMSAYAAAAGQGA